MKRILSLLLVLMMIFSFPVFAEETEEKIDEIDILTSICNVLEVRARYPEVDGESLYNGALEAILKEHPELLESAISGMLSSIDEHSAYYNEEQKKKLFESLSDEIVGIGVTVLAREGKVLVSQPLPGSPAEKAGIKAGDIIAEADGVSLDGMDIDTAVGYIRGEVGTAAKLKIWRSSIDSFLEFTVIREKVESPSVDFEIVEEGKKKALRINLYSFTENSHKQFKEALSQADKEGIKNIIIDLRNNGGGYLDQAIMIADEFLEEGKIITTEDHKIDLLDVVYTAEGKKTDYKVVILINEMSASASEVLTAALKENDAAKVIGKKSYGKGTVQTINNVYGGGAIKYTTAYYLTPLGNNINEIGITPHAEVENSLKEVDMSQFGEFDYNNVFSLGNKAEQIKTAKEMLSYLGIYIGEINDVYDENMRIAVSTFQKIEGLFPYGVLDKTTQFNLYKTMSELKEEVDDQLKAALSAF